MSYLLRCRKSKEFGSEQNLKAGWRVGCNNPAIAANSSQEPWIKYSTADAPLHSNPQFSTKIVRRYLQHNF